MAYIVKGQVQKHTDIERMNSEGKWERCGWILKMHMFDNESAEPKPQNYAIRHYYDSENRFRAEVWFFQC